MIGATAAPLADGLNQMGDYSKMDNLVLLREYYEFTKPHLDKEDINFLMDNFEPEMCVLGCKIALSEYDIDVDFADVDRIDEWVERYGKYMNIGS